MALMLKENDLRPLFENPASMDGLLDVVTDALRSHQRAQATIHADLRIPVAEGKRTLRFVAATVPGCGLGVRAFPLYSGARDAVFILLFDDQSGHLLALVAGQDLNVWRTGAPAGVACRYLARPGAAQVGLLGSGRQARGQILAIRRALPSLQKVRVYSPTEEHRSGFARRMEEWLQIEVEPVRSARAAVEGADIVDVATSCRSPVLEAPWVSPGALIITIASGQIPPEVVKTSRVFASWKKEMLEGKPPREPYNSMIDAGEWSADKIAGELGEVILGRVAARERDGEVVLFEMPGMPLWDTAAVAWAYRWAVQNNAGTEFTLG